MLVTVEQGSELAAGVAHLRLLDAGGLDLAASLTIDIATNIEGTDKHLDASQTGAAVWAAGERWFAVETAAGSTGQALVMVLGDPTTRHLKPFAAYRISIRDDHGHRVDGRMSWINLRLPSTPPPGAPVISIPASRSEPVPVPVLESNPVDDYSPVQPSAETAPPPAVMRPAAAVRPSRRPWVVGGFLTALLIIGGGLWFLIAGFPIEDAPEPPVAAEVESPTSPSEVAPPSAPDVAQIPLTLGSARTFLRGEAPSADAAFEEAERFRAAGEMEAAFLLFKYAAGKGSAAAAYEMGRLADPALPAAEVLPRPDPVIAAEWYERAALAGHVEAMVRLGEMLGDGSPNHPPAVDQSVFWLRKAAAAGSEKAQELLR